MYSEIAFPTAIRQLFTYQVPEEFISSSLLGKRVWVPYRNSYAIGVVVKTHSNKPTFDTKLIREVLDDFPILNQELLELTHWIHKFYFCSWGEVIQAALPAGLNFVSNTYVRLKDDHPFELSSDEKYIIDELKNDGSLNHKEAQQRWRNSKNQKVYRHLIKIGVIELWEEPSIKTIPKMVKWVEWGDEKNGEIANQFLSEISNKNKWQTTLEALIDIPFPQKLSTINSLELVSSYSFQKLKKEGWVQVIERESTTQFDHLVYQPDALKQLNEDQLIAFTSIAKSLKSQEFSNYLLYGITGSGKTEVYIHALKLAIESGKGGIVLVPEIALTPQTVARFYQIYGNEIAVLHSRMTNSERLTEWKSIDEGKKRIVIGARSAVFAPVQDLGIIILDEEHDASYKQIDPSPRYHAREVAIVRAKASNAVVVMGSATPSMQALKMVDQHKAVPLSLNKRHAEATLPEVKIIDLTQYKSAMRGSMSVALYNAISESLEHNEQSILLYNRRGFANYMQCEACGNIPKSPESSVSLTYHKRTNMLKCHYSGYSRRADTNCEICGSNNLLIQGSGTQKIEEEVAELFPSARILRFDKDSTSRKGAHEKILSQFGRLEADILVGTQLVAKGLDFPNVTTVGVIDADTEQAFPSFISSERLYQLLSQVAGRSGRGQKKGNVYIQTRQANNPAIQFAKKHDHVGFTAQEMKFREELNYPPFSRLIQFVFKGKEEHKVIQSAKILEQTINRFLPNHSVLGPSAGVISWLKGMYLWELSIKIETERGANFIEKILDTLMQEYQIRNGSSAATVRVNINVDAQR